MNKVRKGGRLRYLEALGDVEGEGSYYALASPRESEAIWPYTMSTRDFISNTDRLFQRVLRKAKATLGMTGSREGRGQWWVGCVPT